MAQLMPLPLTVSCSSKIQIGFTFLVPAYPGCPGKEAVKGCVSHKQSQFKITKIRKKTTNCKPLNVAGCQKRLSADRVGSLYHPFFLFQAARPIKTQQAKRQR